MNAETVNVNIRGREFMLPRLVYEYFKDLIEWGEAMQQDALRQMTIQLQTSGCLRAVTNTPDPHEKSWVAFCFHFPAYVAIGGTPTAAKLGSILCDYFPIAHLTFRDHTFCLKDDFRQKQFEICHKKTGATLGYELELAQDGKQLLSNICEALRFIGYDFGIEYPRTAYSHLEEQARIAYATTPTPQ